eukprot:gnl/MRDRNA2_/MRDRNA2_20297_c0_seq1.p1 gnl/MRDRNA2_/MRDRNA2_20297_c0~~gnl/MRDRNA2_/MRDRNA2_20297_c0_seq1.p1  ORF type:complete len:375 (-),score=59.04 gnl/MRDRNA2_/MRDRNA2_20297_c0_seq1:276-1331(-)
MGNSTGMNSVEELAAEARFGIVGIGWQFNQVTPGHLEQYEIETARALKALRPDIKVMVSRNTEAAAYFWDSCREKMTNPASRDFWTQCGDQPCAQDWSAPGSHNHSKTITPGYYFNYSNPRLVDWWVNEYIGGALNNSMIDGVYFDCACIPMPGVRDQEEMQEAAQVAFDQALAKIEAAGKWATSWWGGILPQPGGLSDDSLGHVHTCAGNMRKWIKVGLNDTTTLQILGAHFSDAKPHDGQEPSNTRAENNTIAAFLISRGKNAVLSLLDNNAHRIGWAEGIDYGWSSLFDMDFGEPVGPPVESPANVFTRHYTKISTVTLDCNTLTSSFGSMQGDGLEPASAVTHAEFI